MLAWLLLVILPMTIAIMDRLKQWGKGEIDRLKEAAIAELDPRNPVKPRLIGAWGLLISGGLLLLVLAFALAMLIARD